MSEREDISFESGGERCAAWLYRPEGEGPHPCVVLAHGFGGVREARLWAYAERFREAGLAALVFDYRHFGASSGEPRQLLSVKRQLEDWRAALAFARSLEGVDTDRIVAWGTSMSGGHVLTVAARDHEIAAAIVQCPFTDAFASSSRADPRTSVRLLAAAVRDRVGALAGCAPVYLPAAAPPGTVALMNAPDVVPGIEAITRGVDGFDDRITARAVFDILRYRPGRTAGDITCPLFAALCEHDSLAPARAARHQIASAPQAEIAVYPIGHFDIYVGRDFDRAVGDYLAFLQAHVPVARSG